MLSLLHMLDVYAQYILGYADGLGVWPLYSLYGVLQ